MPDTCIQLVETSIPPACLASGAVAGAGTTSASDSPHHSGSRAANLHHFGHRAANLADVVTGTLTSTTTTRTSNCRHQDGNAPQNSDPHCSVLTAPDHHTGRPSCHPNKASEGTATGLAGHALLPAQHTGVQSKYSEEAKPAPDSYRYTEVAPAAPRRCTLVHACIVQTIRGRRRLGVFGSTVSTLIYATASLCWLQSSPALLYVSNMCITSYQHYL